MKYFLLIWVLTIDGHASMSGQGFETLEECQQAEQQMMGEMAKSLARGRWELIIKDFKVLGCHKWMDESGFVKITPS